MDSILLLLVMASNSFDGPGRREAAWLGAALYHERAGRKMMNVLWPQKINRGPVATPAGHFFATYAP